MKWYTDRLIVILILGALGWAALEIGKLEDETVKQEPLLCEEPKTGKHYVENYAVDKNYVIDFKSGGVWGVNFCRAYKGE